MTRWDSHAPDLAIAAIISIGVASAIIAALLSLNACGGAQRRDCADAVSRTGDTSPCTRER